MGLSCMLQGVEALHAKKYKSDWLEIGQIGHLLSTRGSVAFWPEDLMPSLVHF
jgi:hypothetical protein